MASDSDIATARRIAAERAGGVLGVAETARLDELVAALGGHAMNQPGGGTLLIGRVRGGAGVECLAYDRSPATGSTPADDALPLALSAARGLADRFLIHATPGIGTALLARVLRPGASDLPPEGAVAQVGAVMVARDDGAAPDDPASARIDSWFVRCDAARGPEGPCGIALLIDGDVGNEDNSGIDGGDAEGILPPSAVTPAVIRQVEAVVAATVPGLPAPMVVNAIRRDLLGRPELGLAPDREVAGLGRSAIAVLRFDGAAVDYTALGTVAGAVVRRQEILSLGARWAMVGFNPLAPAAVHLLWGPGDHVVLYSGGCSRLPALFINRGLRDLDPTLAALVLLRDGVVRDDDHTILVLRNRSNPAA
ncbi:hypothetical protein [Azospirillum sp. TSO35-2]|uniref:hypothetical protein n=1 Tax=Azospirillum sp. TSO35-2 TaxID=716796 RepID=UPI001FFF086A|nr:hypothetical protein [Azospirillum sp. TSO35-2]